MSGDFKKERKKVEIIRIDKIMKVQYKEAVHRAEGFFMWGLGTPFPLLSSRKEVGMENYFTVKKHFPKNRKYLRLSAHSIPTSTYLAKCRLCLTT